MTTKQSFIYSGFRYNCLVENEEFFNSPTCRFVKVTPILASEEDRICGEPGVLNEEGQHLPSCEKHKELYELLKHTFISIREDKTKFSELLKPQPFIRSIGVDLSNKA